MAIAYLVACLIYFVVSIVIFIVGKNAISKKFIVISTVVSTLVFVAVSICFWTIDAKAQVDPIRVYLLILVFGMVFGIAFPTCSFCVKNAMLLVKNALKDNPQQKEKIATLVGYGRMKKNGLITKEEYEQKERELFGDDDLITDDVAVTDDVKNA